MKLSVGDIVRFKVGFDDVELGEVKFIEKINNETILYINGFSGWAYKVSEKKIIPSESQKLNLIPKLNKSYLTRGMGFYREETGVSVSSQS
ncbi:MAG: hypothetical protein OIN66_03815 [Candidatus Methanoperedens sp.]|nr:hypothetical protein [Candidatus Methanoperedens sp.]